VTAIEFLAFTNDAAAPIDNCSKDVERQRPNRFFHTITPSQVYEQRVGEQ
jgi:hypothetical protein